MISTDFGISDAHRYAPFDDGYNWKNGSTDAHLYDTTISFFNPYRVGSTSSLKFMPSHCVAYSQGGPYQEAVSALTNTDQTAYEANGGGFAIYGVEYQPGPNGYATWVNHGKAAWTQYASAVGKMERNGFKWSSGIGLLTLRLRTQFCREYQPTPHPARATVHHHESRNESLICIRAFILDTICHVRSHDFLVADIPESHVSCNDVGRLRSSVPRPK